MWIDLPFHQGEKGSENGIILKDEEYKRSCRITLEKSPRYYCITCGIYGSITAEIIRTIRASFLWMIMTCVDKMAALQD